jgi:hypothetical protein
MNTQHQLIAATALFLSSGLAMASEDYGVAFSKEANSCIAAVNEHADYDDATRVKHDVVELKNTFSGYVLEIETKVFGDSGDIAVRQYSSHCVARDDNAPRKFSIEEVSG